MTQQLPFSPLTHHELNTRADRHEALAGGRVGAIFRIQGEWKPAEYDIAYLAEHAALSDGYHAAALVRCQEVSA